MAENTRNLCAQIPVELHGKVRERQEASGLSLSQYMTRLITQFFETEGKTAMAKEGQRTVAFHVSDELFERFKEYLKRNVIKQNAFFLECINRALEQDAEGAREAE